MAAAEKSTSSTAAASIRNQRSKPGLQRCRTAMPTLNITRVAVATRLPRNIRPQVATSCPEPPAGDGWLHEPKHDGHRLIVIATGDGRLKLVSRKGNDRTALFRAPFDDLAAVGRAIVLDGEIAVPDDRGVTHIDALNDAISRRQPDRLAYFAFDILYLDRHDLRRCGIEERKAVLRDVVSDLGCPRIAYLDHVVGRGAELFEQVRALGGEGIVSKRRGRPYRGGASRDWLKCKVHEIGKFVVTGSRSLARGGWRRCMLLRSAMAGSTQPVRSALDSLAAVYGPNLMRGVTVRLPAASSP
ncbi:MAG: hypothetical protein JO058_19575 [Alphaproteobacteria bacterium]|nr:hypothetical protein [Alphaproteobacteria bacterium]MBV9965054.1 hypothetical protein [Alphaproteobacteria bacterium]